MARKKRIACIIGIVIGGLILLLGIGGMSYSSSMHLNGVGVSNMAFGADFYTEIYDVTREVGEAVNDNTAAVLSLGSTVMEAAGFVLIAMGLTVVAFFVYKLCSIENDTSSNNTDYYTAPVNQPVVPDLRDLTRCSCGEIHDGAYCPICGKKAVASYEVPTAAASPVELAWKSFKRREYIVGKCTSCGKIKQELVYLEYEDNFGKGQGYICYECFCKKYK